MNNDFETKMEELDEFAAQAESLGYKGGKNPAQ